MKKGIIFFLFLFSLVDAQAQLFPAIVTQASAGTTLATPSLNATVISSTQIDLGWTDVANESGYSLEFSLNGTSGWTTIYSAGIGATVYSHTGRTPSTTYYYRVSAVGNGTTFLTSGYGTANATTTSSGGDVTAPTIVSIAKRNFNTGYGNNTIQVVFSESTTPTTGGWTFVKDGSSNTLTGVSGSGTTWVFTFANNWEIGEVIQYSYSQSSGNTVDGSGNELANATNQAVSNPEPTPSVVVNPATYGVSPSNTAAQNASALASFQAAYQGADKGYVHLDFNLNAGWTGRILINGNGWLAGIDSIKVTYRGEMQNTISTDGDIGEVPVQTNGYLIDNPSGPIYRRAPLKFATAAAGATTITLLDANTDLAVGDYIGLAGYEDQLYGYPPNARHLEWNYITAISGSTITLKSPLKYSYNQNWRDYTNGTAAFTAAPGYWTNDAGAHGKPRIFKLNPKYMSFVYLEGMNWVPNPNTSAGFTSAIRLVADFSYFKNVISEDIWASENRYMLIIGGQYGIAEFDKYNGICKAVGVHFTGKNRFNANTAAVSAATGVDSLIIDACILDNYCPLSPRALTFINNTSVTKDGNSNIYTHPEGVNVERMTIKNNTFTGAALGSSKHIQWGTYAGGSFVAQAGTNSSVIKMSVPATHASSYANPIKTIGDQRGFRIASGAISAEVTSITWDGTHHNVNITNVTGGTPASGQTWSWGLRSDWMNDQGGNTSLSGKGIY